MKRLILSTALLCSMLSACSTDTAQTEQSQEGSISSEATETTEPAIMSPDSTQADTTAHGHSHGGGEEHEH